VSHRAYAKIQRIDMFQDAVKAIALCHNVTPVFEGSAEAGGSSGSEERSPLESQSKVDQSYWRSTSGQSVTYQASSPDEVTRQIKHFVSSGSTGPV
jgi:hypothetical protein